MKQPKVLILTTNYGNGHLQVAQALVDRFKSVKRADIAVRDLYQEANPRIHEWTKKLYLKSYTKGGRQLYRLFYYSSQEIAKRKNLKIFSYGYSKLSKIIAEEQPDAIINTFPTLAVPHFLMKTNSDIPIYNVVTDYCFHHSWVHPVINKYFVATEQLKSQLIDDGIDENKIAVTGIPVQNQFDYMSCHQTLLNKYQLKPNLKTILVVAGAYGVSKEMKYICEELKTKENLQILIVCGKNKQLYEELKGEFHNERHIRIFGYVTHMAELFQLATCVITKPGGIILSEAISKNVPIILPRATPGQEKENAQFFESCGAAISCEKWEQVVMETCKLVNDEAKLKKMKTSLASIHVPHATNTIINDVIQIYYQQRILNTLSKV